MPDPPKIVSLVGWELAGLTTSLIFFYGSNGKLPMIKICFCLFYNIECNTLSELPSLSICLSYIMSILLEP